jgi:protein ImuB
VREPATSQQQQRKGKQNPENIPHILHLLHKWGIHTIGQFTRLDKEEIRARLGGEAVRLWERAQGKCARLLKFVQPPESFSESFEFEYEVETAEPLLFMLRRFLQQLALRLNGVYLVARELTLRIQFSNKQNYERRFQIPQPTIDVDLLFRMLQTHLEDFKSDQPIIALSLEAQPTKAVSQQFGLFETTLRNPNRLYETLARLAALLGRDRVGTPVLEDSYRPDAFRLDPFSWELGPGELDPVRSKKKAMPASLRRFRPSLPASVLLQNDQPIHLRSAPLTGSVAEQQGPYRASGNWWDEKKWSRSEWDVEIEKGSICRFHSDEKNWELDGLYD